MNWRKESGGSGAMWAGTDSIYNVSCLTPDAKAANGMGLIVLILASAGFLGGAVAALYNGIEVAGWAIPCLLLSAAFGVPAYWLAKVFQRPQWLRNDWELSVLPSVLKYAPDPGPLAAPAWSVPLSEVASVEAGRTHDWSSVRIYPGDGKPSQIPDVEYQAYVMTSDGRRLVIHTANAGREECSALALAVRAAVEASRTSAAPAVQATAAPSPTSVEKGFSL